VSIPDLLNPTVPELFVSQTHLANKIFSNRIGQREATSSLGY
jgi:hypothetical protein